MNEDKKLIAYCGLYCGDCVNYKGEIADLARDLRKKLRQEKFDRVSKGLSKYFKEFKDYEKCYATLGAMVRLRCSRVCRDGGGPPFCKIRKCCEKKNIPSKTQKWKSPVHVWIREMYQKRQEKTLRKKASKKDAQVHGVG